MAFRTRPYLDSDFSYILFYFSLCVKIKLLLVVFQPNSLNLTMLCCTVNLFRIVFMFLLDSDDPYNRLLMIVGSGQVLVQVYGKVKFLTCSTFTDDGEKILSGQRSPLLKRS